MLTDIVLEDDAIQNSTALEKLKRIKKDADDLYFGIKDFIWTIDSKSDQLDELIVYLKDFGEELFQDTGIRFLVDKDVDQEQFTLPYYWSRQLVLLFKEVMTNALKHSEATEVELLFYKKKEVLMIIFKDNGKGFDMGQLRRKNGLVNMQKRVRKIGGELLIESQDGTAIIFKGEAVYK